MRGSLFIAGLLALGLLPGCSVLEGGLFGPRRAEAPAEPALPDSGATPATPESAAQATPESTAQAMPTARTAEAMDATSDEERAAAVDAARPAGGEVLLGTTIASLGAVSEPGIWLKTPLVSAPAKGRVVYPEKGTSVLVDLVPLEGDPGAGSRISLAAMRLLEAELTGLPELRVYRLN